MSDFFIYKPKEGDKIRILPAYDLIMDYSSLYPSVIKYFGTNKNYRKIKIKKILDIINDSNSN